MPKKGKKGTEQRTKGNVKAASSGRMTELMGGDTGFIGFEVVSSDSINGGSPSDEVLLGVHSSFQVVLKQMGKRDTTTKLKALNEFVNLCDREPAESVISCLKLWPLMYCKVCMDNDYRVREVTHLALKACGLAVKKHLGPHVRSMMGCWVSCMCDPIPQNAITAQTAFTSVFPLDKQTDVYKFALRDIVSFVRNLVLKETPDTFTDPKIYPEDERIERYERAVSMAISGLGYTLKQLQEDYLYEEEAMEIWQGILKEGRLWKLSRHKNPLIRSSVYGLVCSLAVSTQYLLTEFKHFCSLVLGGLSEKDPVVIGPLWDAVLYLIDSDKEWASQVNIQKGVLPGLWALIEGGGYGNGTRVFPCLLPLLNGLMKVYNEDINFCLNFLQRLSKSFSSDSARISLSDTQAIMNCFNECFFLILKYNISSAVRLIEIVMALFESTMSEDITVQYSVLSGGVATVMLKAIKLVETENDQVHAELCEQCHEYLIRKLSEIVTQKENQKLIDRVGNFLTSFCVPSSGNPPNTDGHAHNTTRHTSYTSFIIPIVGKVCSLCLIEATPTRISLVQKLIVHFDENTDQLVTIISKQVRPDQPDDTDQLDQLVDHMINLCDSNKGVEPLLVDSVVSLLCNGGKMDRLVSISKEKTHLAPLILTKVADKGCDVDKLVKEIMPVLVPSDESFKEALSSPYFLKLLRAMLTENGHESLKNLSLCRTMVSQLCRECCLDSVAEVLSQLDKDIIKDNGEVLVNLLNRLLQQVLCYEDNTITASLDRIVICYSHILTHLPDIDSYLVSVRSTILERLSKINTANEVMWVGLCFKYLICGSLTSLESVYEQFASFVTKADNEITNKLPPSVFQMFCDGELHYSPPTDSSLVTLCSFVPRALFPSLLMAVCLVNDKETLQDIGEDRFTTESLLRNKLTVFGTNENVLVSALFYISAVSIYSNKGSLISHVCQLSIQILLEGLKDITKLPFFIIDQARDGPVWSLCLNHLLCSSDNSGPLLQSILSNVSSFQCQLVLYKVNNDHYVQEILKRNLQDPCIVAGCLMLLTDKKLITGAASSMLTMIVEKHNKKELTILGDDIDCCKDPLVLSVLELMIQLVRLNSTELDSTLLWDFIMCQSVSLIQLLSDTYTELSLEGVVMFCRGLMLCCEVNSCLLNDSLSSYSSASEEWKEFFLPTIQDILLPYFLKIKGSSQTTDKTVLYYYICTAVIELSLQPPPDRWEELIAMVATCQLYSEQVTGFLLALRVLKTMSIKCIGDNTEGTDISSIQSYVGSFLLNLDIQTVFNNHDDIDQDDYYDNYNLTVSYLLLWLLVCEIVGKCDIEARVVMTEWIKEKCQLNLLLQRMFEHCSSLSPQQLKGVSLTPSLSGLCNALFFSIAQHLPPMLRQWFNTLDKQVSTQVMNFTSKNVTPKLWMNEVKNIHNSKPKATDLEVKVYCSSMEVFVAYRLDDFSIELSVIVPDCYPLLAPSIKEGKRARVDTNLWRKWLLQLNAFVANQNGTLLEGLMVWKSNLDKHFAGLEDCMICFSVIHGSNYSLPKMCCRTCKKKFHSSCLYKWFSTSAKSTCPLCRNVF